MGGCLPAALLCLQWRWALPWGMLLLLLSSQLQVTHSWTSEDERKNDDQKIMESYFPATVEYALHMFNQKSKDMNAYRLVRILNSWKEQVGDCIFLPCWPLSEDKGQETYHRILYTI